MNCSIHCSSWLVFHLVTWTGSQSWNSLPLSSCDLSFIAVNMIGAVGAHRLNNISRPQPSWVSKVSHGIPVEMLTWSCGITPGTKVSVATALVMLIFFSGISLDLLWGWPTASFFTAELLAVFCIMMRPVASCWLLTRPITLADLLVWLVGKSKIRYLAAIIIPLEEIKDASDFNWVGSWRLDIVRLIRDSINIKQSDRYTTVELAQSSIRYKLAGNWYD